MVRRLRDRVRGVRGCELARRGSIFVSPYRRPFRWTYRNRGRLTFAVAFLGAIAIGYWLIVLTGRVNRAEVERQRQEAIRVATAEANYDSCLRSIPFYTKLNEAFVGLQLEVPTVEECDHRRTQEISPP